MGHVPKYGKGKWKTNREEHSQNAPPERPDKTLRTRHGSKFSGTATRTGQRLSRCGRSQENRYILPAPAMERPRTSESAPVRGSNGGVRCARKSDTMNERVTTYVHHNGKWLCRQMKKSGGENRCLARQRNLAWITAAKATVHLRPQAERSPSRNNVIDHRQRKGAVSSDVARANLPDSPHG